MSLRKLVRTVLNYAPFGRDTTEAVQQVVMSLTRQPHERDFLALRYLPADALLLDVGANHGQSILSMQLVAPGATIIAFEPNLRLATKVARRWKRRRQVTVHPVGLSDRDRSMPLYVPSYRGMTYDGLASLDQREALQWLNADAIYGFDPAYVGVTTMTCALRTLDSFQLPQPPRFMKIDAQGHEAAVLAGGAATLASARPVVMVEGAWRDPAIAAHLGPHGYGHYELHGRGSFVATSATARTEALNSFFVTPDRQAEMTARGAAFS
jgi:FkbM family methyltransferase